MMSDPTQLDPLPLLLYELMDNPVCKCHKSCKSCLVSLIDDSMGQATLVNLMTEFEELSIKGRVNFFKQYAQAYDCIQPYIFVSDDRTEATAIPLCFNSTASIFKLSREYQKQYFISPSGRKELQKQRLNSDLMCATAQFLRTAPLLNSYFAPVAKIDWSHEAFVGFHCSIEHLQRHMTKHGIHPFKGDLTYAVKNSRTGTSSGQGLGLITKYDQLLSELKGCHVTLTQAQNSLLQKLKKLAPAQATSKQWKKVAPISLQYSQQNSKKKQMPSTYLVHYMPLESNTLLGTYTKHLRRSCQLMEWDQWKLIIDEITLSCQSAISSVSSETKTLDFVVTSILYSAIHGLQNPHYDFKNEVLDKNGENMYLGFSPLTEDGMFLQVWTKEGYGKVLYIPLGELVILPSSTMHAGGFCSRAHEGNLRLHFYFYLNKVPSETHNTNVYSDERGEFSEIYLNAVVLVKGVGEEKIHGHIGESGPLNVAGCQKESCALTNLFAK